MFELPEYVNLASQINSSLVGRTVRSGIRGSVPHKFVWYNRTPEEFAALTRGRTVGKASSRGKWLFVPLEPGCVLVLGECGGKVLFHPAGSRQPAKHHLLLGFEDGSAFSVTTQMWGAMELFEGGQEKNRRYIKDMRPTPVEPVFTPEYLSALIDELPQGEKRSAKGLLTQDQLIPGLGNAIAQDILFRARLHPKHPVQDLGKSEIGLLCRSIRNTVGEIIDKGGRNDELDLFGNRGGYRRIMDKGAVGRPCPDCGAVVEKIQYLGGACYFCPSCQL